MDVIKEDQVLDCTGMLCPMPIVKTTKAMKELESGQILKMISTDAGSPPDIAAWSRQTGNELLLSTEENKKFIFFFVMTLPFGFVFNLGYLVIPVVVFIFYVLASLELIAEEIEDPFGLDINDLPTDELAVKIDDNVREILLPPQSAKTE